MKALLLEPLFSKVAGLRACSTGAFHWNLQNFLEHLFLKTTCLRVNLYLQCMKKKHLTISSKRFYHRYLTWFSVRLWATMIVFAITIQMTITSSHQRCSARESVLRNFAKFRGKHLCQVLFFNKVAGPNPATLFKKRLWHRCFPLNFAKILRIPFSQNASGRLLLDKQHFLAENPRKVLKGKQQHKGLIFHWSRISPLLVKLF